MKDNMNEIKKANRKALPVFILVMVLSIVFGAVLGFCVLKFGLDRLTDAVKSAALFFGDNIAPWLMVALAVVLPIVCAPFYHRAKKLLSSWDGENEEISDAAEAKLSAVIWITGVSLVLSYFFFAAAFSGEFSTLKETDNMFPYTSTIAAFFAVLIETVILQQKCVDGAKKTNPEKTASIYDMKFHKKWIDSCDEAEKIMIGKCAFKAYGATNKVCSFFSVVLAICAVLFGTGFFPSLVVCVIWLVNQSAYLREAMKYSKAGNKIM